jgi:hypothetical protein
MRLRMCADWYAGFVACIVVFTLLGVPVGDARAQDVQPGFDLYITNQTNTQFDFNPQPIPADYFGPGSDPFDGVIALKGLPLPQNPFCPLPPTLCPNDDLTYVDTIVERLDTASLPGVGSSDVIETEIVALSLVSVDPIVVTYNGGLDPELWDVRVCLSETQTTGNMLIDKTHANGGTFDSDLAVVPLFTFTRQSDSAERVLDGYPSYLDILEAVSVPWEYASPDPLSCRSNFCAPDEYEQAGLLAAQGLFSTCGGSEVPAMPRAATAVLIVAVASLGAYLIRRLAVRA